VKRTIKAIKALPMNLMGNKLRSPIPKDSFKKMKATVGRICETAKATAELTDVRVSLVYLASQVRHSSGVSELGPPQPDGDSKPAGTKPAGYFRCGLTALIGSRVG
jgi:hypothetical protein